MFPNGLIVYFRMMANKDLTASAVFHKGRSIKLHDSTGFVTILDEDEGEIGLCAEDFISAILPLPPSAPDVNN